jgi:hypothetical protein
MGDEVSRGIGGWVISVTTRGRGERDHHVAMFHVALAKANDAIDAVAQACGAPISTVAIEAPLSHATLALMRLKQGELRMRKSLRRPRDINQLAKRIADMATDDGDGREFAEGESSAAVSLGPQGGKVRAAATKRHVELMAKRTADAMKQGFKSADASSHRADQPGRASMRNRKSRSQQSH